MILKYKDKYPVANKLSVFNHYKRITGRSLERDMQEVQKREQVLNDESSTIEQVNEALEIDIIEIIQYVYYAFRCSGEVKILEVDTVMDELDIADLTDGSLVELINNLMEVKKKYKSATKQKKQVDCDKAIAYAFGKLGLSSHYQDIWTLADLFQYIDLYVDLEKISIGKGNESVEEYQSSDEIARF